MVDQTIYVGLCIEPYKGTNIIYECM